jgi:hypothetical protein
MRPARNIYVVMFVVFGKNGSNWTEEMLLLRLSFPISAALHFRRGLFKVFLCNAYFRTVVADGIVEGKGDFDKGWEDIW